jgi:hypothetical protein
MIIPWLLLLSPIPMQAVMRSPVRELTTEERTAGTIEPGSISIG